MSSSYGRQLNCDIFELKAAADRPLAAGGLRPGLSRVGGRRAGRRSLRGGGVPRAVRAGGRGRPWGRGRGGGRV